MLVYFLVIGTCKLPKPFINKTQVTLVTTQGEQKLGQENVTILFGTHRRSKTVLKRYSNPGIIRSYLIGKLAYPLALSIPT